jgi:hypothetical protein
MVVTLQLVLAATQKRVSDVYGGTPGTPDETKNISYRQLILSAVGADVFLGSTSGVTTGNGFKVALTATMPTTLGPFPTGAVKLSDLYAIGTGATLNILGVPY